ncbi:MAG: hypothetical protein ACLFVT_03940 [Syntrophobacteria bacterium]
MQGDYIIITVFSKRKAKTRSFKLDRRFLYVLLSLMLLLALSSAFFAQAFVRQRLKGQPLRQRVVELEQLVAELETRLGGEEEALPDPPANQTARSPATPDGQRKQKDEGTECQAAKEHKAGPVQETSPSRADYAKIESPRVGPLDSGSGFRFTFKLVNLAGEPISGNVAIIACLKPPHKPRFVSFPQMELANGMPVKLRKSVGFSIRRFKYVTGRFFFPFSCVESFHVLIYNQESHLALDTTVPAEKIEKNALESKRRSEFSNSSWPA